MPPKKIPVPPPTDAPAFAAFVRTQLRYDPETGVFVRLKGTGGEPAGKQAGVIGVNGYLHIGAGYKKLTGHRLAWLLVHNVWPDREIDHINGDRSDNRLANLRLATPQENGRNKRKYAGAVKYKGVYFNKDQRKYQAYINVQKKAKYLGLHETPEDAARAYNRAAAELFGEFARLNDV